MNMQVLVERSFEEEAKEVENLVERLYKPSETSKIKEINDSLTKTFHDAEKIGLMKFLLYHSNSFYTKMYAANSIYQVVTDHFLSVDWKTKLEIYQFLIKYIVNLTDFLENPVSRAY